MDVFTEESTGDPVGFCHNCNGVYNTWELHSFEGNWHCDVCLDALTIDFDECELLAAEFHDWKSEGF